MPTSAKHGLVFFSDHKGVPVLTEERAAGQEGDGLGPPVAPNHKLEHDQAARFLSFCLSLTGKGAMVSIPLTLSAK